MIIMYDEKYYCYHDKIGIEISDLDTTSVDKISTLPSN